MTARLVAALSKAGVEATPLEIAEALWLAQFASGATEFIAAPGRAAVAPAKSRVLPSTSIGPAAPTADVYPDTGGVNRDVGIIDALRVGGPRVPALHDALAIARSLRPLKQMVRSHRTFAIDEAATADRVAYDGLWMPVLRPQWERQFNLTVIVDGSASMLIWQRTVQEFRTVLQQIGAFRTIRSLAIDTDHAPLELQGTSSRPIAILHPLSIIDPSRRQLIMVLTDGIGAAWGDGRMDQLLQRWGAVNPVQVITLLPRRLWRAAGLHTAFTTTRSHRRGGRTAVPVVELAARSLHTRAKDMAANLSTVTGEILQPPTGLPVTTAPTRAADRLQQFFWLASPAAQRLAICLASAPLTLPVMRLVQNVILPHSTPAHLAEILLGGLVILRSPASEAVDPELVEFDFESGVRGLLLDLSDQHDALQVLAAVSRYVGDHLNQPFDFPALLLDPDAAIIPRFGIGTLPVARLSAAVLRRLGPRYATLADRLDAAATAFPERREIVADSQWQSFSLADVDQLTSPSDETVATLATIFASFPGMRLMADRRRYLPMVADDLGVALDYEQTGDRRADIEGMLRVCAAHWGGIWALVEVIGLFYEGPDLTRLTMEVAEHLAEPVLHAGERAQLVQLLTPVVLASSWLARASQIAAGSGTAGLDQPRTALEAAHRLENLPATADGIPPLLTFVAAVLEETGEERLTTWFDAVAARRGVGPEQRAAMRQRIHNTLA